MKKVLKKIRKPQKPNLSKTVNNITLDKVADAIHESSVSAIKKLEEGETSPSRPNQKNRKMFGYIGLACVSLLLIFMSRHLWPLNKIVSLQADSHGTYIEGSIGNIGNLNPVYASTPAEKSAAKLMFSPLFKHDEDGQLTGELAEKFEANEDSKIFTVKLKDDIKWTDGEKITAEDVVKTYELIQHPDSDSPYRNNWRGVKVQSTDEKTVTFSLQDSYATFAHSLTNPIIPEHAFADSKPNELRSHNFNQQPVISSGPFKFVRLDAESGRQLDLTVSNEYHGEKPKLKEFVFKTFPNNADLITSYQSGDLAAIAGLDLGTALNEATASQLIAEEAVVKFPYNASVMLFFNFDKEPFKSREVRQALAASINTDELAKNTSQLALPLTSPLLSSQFDFSEDSPQQKYDIKRAKKLFDDAGYKLDEDSKIRKKSDKPLAFDILTQNSGIFPQIANNLAAQWRTQGVQVNVVESSASSINQGLGQRSYSTILYGFSSSSNSDPFPLWHSSQVSANGLNLAGLKSDLIDEALESARTKSKRSELQLKYQAFLQEWHRLTPAVSTIQPTYIYIAKPYVGGVKAHILSSPEDRLNQVSDWKID